MTCPRDERAPCSCFTAFDWFFLEACFSAVLFMGPRLCTELATKAHIVVNYEYAQTFLPLHLSGTSLRIYCSGFPVKSHNYLHVAD